MQILEFSEKIRSENPDFWFLKNSTCSINPDFCIFQNWNNLKSGLRPKLTTTTSPDFMLDNVYVIDDYNL